MGLHKILKIGVAVLGLLGVIFLVRIISAGDDVIKAGDDATVDPIAYVAYVVLGLTIAFVLFFVVKNLFTNKGSLKSTLMGGGIFVAILVIAYALSSGADASQYLYNGIAATDKEAHIVGAGLIAFYILIIGAAGSMLLSGVKKIIK